MKILLTGGSGKLGKEIVKLSNEILSPSREELDITNEKSILSYFDKHDIKRIIHCAAIARMNECSLNPADAIETNIIGTCNLVKTTLKKNKNIRFIYISTDGVYPGEKGNYSEKDPTIPYNEYGWTKLGGECAVNLLPNYCIIRTSFFDKEKINFKDAPPDMYESKLEIKKLAKHILKTLDSDFIGTINIGGKRKSRYELYKEFIPELKKIKFEEVEKLAGIKMAKDASMNIDLWEKIKGLD